MKAPLIAFAMLVVSTSALFSQSTTVKLPTHDSTSSFIITDNSNNVLFKIYGTGGYYMLGNYNGASLPVLGTGPRLMWDPHHAALRAGYVSGSTWDSTSIGFWSFAAGNNTTASGDGSTATGESSQATGIISTAMGHSAIASGTASTAFGTGTNASGGWTTAMGYQTTSSGNFSTATGMNTTASGDSSTALGTWVSTNGKSGACIIGDGSSAGTATNSSANDQMTMRFAGGYNLFTNTAASIGVKVTCRRKQLELDFRFNKERTFCKSRWRILLTKHFTTAAWLMELQRTRRRALSPLRTDGTGNLPLLRKRPSRHDRQRHHTCCC